MRFSVHELPRAKEDKRQILQWLLERSRQGAAAWLTAYDVTLQRLEQNADSHGEALENDDCPLVNVRQVLFKTRRGRVYRVVFFTEVTDAYVLRVRGPGQPPLQPDELQ
jgi:hypothetical protein